MKISKKYSIALGIILALGLFFITPYAKDITSTIKIIQNDPFTEEMKKKVEILDEKGVFELTEGMAKSQQKTCPRKISETDTLLEVTSEANRIITKQKMDYTKLLNMKKVNHSEVELNRLLTLGMIKDACSQKLINFITIHKGIIEERRYFDYDMKLRNTIIIDKNTCTTWNKENKLYAVLDDVLKVYNSF